MANIDDAVNGDVRPRHYWVAQILPPPNDDGSGSVCWKTRQTLPPDCPAGTYCVKIQWFQRTSRDGRFFKLASAQYISLACIVPVGFKILLDKQNNSRYEISEETQQKILKTMNGLIIDG